MAHQDLRRRKLRGGTLAERGDVGEELGEAGDVAAGARRAAVAALVERPDRVALPHRPLADVGVAAAVVAEPVQEEEDGARRTGRLGTAEGESGPVRRRPGFDVAERRLQISSATTRRR